MIRQELEVLQEGNRMISQEMLWTQYFTESYLGFHPTSLVDQIAKSIIYRSDLFRVLNDCLYQSKISYHYAPTIGAAIDFQFEEQIVTVTRLGETQCFSRAEFVRLLVLIDKIYTEILPLGTVVQISKDKLPKDILSMFDDELLIHVMITGQRICIENKFYLDYTGYFWPNGLIPNQDPVVISENMIEKVLFRGLENNEIENQYVLNLRRKLLALDVDSYAFQSRHWEENE